jgi:sigma-B regulation protein RsbU (phosphoserine phosphatase)
MRASGDVEMIVSPRPALPVGAMLETTYEAGSVTLQPGDGLFVYSDGITEATDVKGAQFGEARLAATLSEVSRMHGRKLLDDVVGRVREHCRDAPQTDDITALVLRWDP